MKIFIITTLLLLSSCSTKPINVESQKSTTLNQLREFDWNKIKKIQARSEYQELKEWLRIK